MILSLKLLESNSEVYKNILEALLPQANKYMSDAIRNLKTLIPPIIEKAIRISPEYESILYGDLKYQFGIPDSSAKLEGIINIWLKNIDFNYIKPAISNNQIKGSFGINMIRSDFSDVLSSDFAIVQDNLRNYNLDWLKWLLLDGNKIIVPNQEVIFGQNKASRTGFAVMRSSNKSWKVPAFYAGTQDSNWITKAIDSSYDDINKAIIGAFKL
jgi:hypothetical protein